MKKLCVLFILCLSIVGISLVGIKASANEDLELKNKEQYLVDFLKSHFTKFKSEYNKISEEDITATSIEGYSLAYVIDAEEYGVYIDFNNDKGYMVVTFTLNVYALETSGDLEYLKGEKLVYYSSVDGFLYHNGSQYQKYVEKSMENEIRYSYAGQGEPGEGSIYNLDSYMEDRYPSYTYVNQYTGAAYNYRFTDMYDTSYFIKYISEDHGQTYTKYETEANCGITAIFNVMTSWKNTGYMPNLPSKSDTKDIREELKQEREYITYGSGVPGAWVDCYWTLNEDYLLANMPILYSEARYYLRSQDLYKPENGITTDSAMKALEYCTGLYNCTNPGVKSTNLSDVLPFLQKGIAVYMGISNSTMYGEPHAVAFLGYKQYSYKTGWWIFSQTKTAYFFLIDDGQIGCTYFDPNCNSQLSYEFIYAK